MRFPFITESIVHYFMDLEEFSAFFYCLTLSFFLSFFLFPFSNAAICSVLWFWKTIFKNFPWRTFFFLIHQTTTRTLSKIQWFQFWCLWEILTSSKTQTKRTLMFFHVLFLREMATRVEPPNGFRSQGKHYYTMWQTLFEIDTKYVPIKPIGRGSYGVVCSSVNMETNEKVAIKKINNVFENRVDALRTLRELKLLRHIQHENVIALKDVMMPTHQTSFKDVYLVYELMDTDLHHIIKSPQPLVNEHCKYFIFQVLNSLKQWMNLHLLSSFHNRSIQMWYWKKKNLHLCSCVSLKN